MGGLWTFGRETGEEPTTGQTPNLFREPLKVDEDYGCVVWECAATGTIIVGSSGLDFSFCHKPLVTSQLVTQKQPKTPEGFQLFPISHNGSVSKFKTSCKIIYTNALRPIGFRIK